MILMTDFEASWDGKPRWAYELDLLLWEWNRLMEKQAAEKRRERQKAQRKIKKQVQRKKFGRR